MTWPDADPIQLRRHQTAPQRERPRADATITVRLA
jgi:hypothetical protein